MARTPNSVCKVCGGSFYKRPSQKTGNDFCSTRCYAIWKTKPKRKKCENCGETFQYKRREQRFCSLLCATMRPRPERANGTGRNKSQGILRKFSSMGWNGECMISGCHYSMTLDAHRVVSGKRGGRYSDDNICILCPNHHAEVHRLKYKIKKVGFFMFDIVNC